MIAELKPYSETKKSGLPWLKTVPVHWELRRMKFLFRERVQKNYPQEPLLAATQTKGVVLKADYGSRTVTAQKDFHLLKLVETGDFVISLRSFEGGIEVAHCRGIISPAYTILKPIHETSRGYFTHFFKSTRFIQSLTLFVTGIREGQNIDYERLSRAYVPLPPPTEQAAIVRFLNHASGRIERAIRAKRRLIALLNEQKQTLIHRAVTRGLDPAAPMKDSGVEWIGEIPGHWNCRKMKYLVSMIGGMTPSKSNEKFWNGNVPWVSPKDMKIREISDSKDHISKAALEQTSISLIQPPAVLIVVRGMILARTFPTAVTSVPVTINQDMKALKVKPVVNPSYLVSLLTGIKSELLNLVEEAGHGTKCLRTDSWESFKIPIPPLNEQEQILKQLDSETATLNTALARTEHEIKLLQEYRTRLIADVVTGQLDVREAAQRLPADEEPLPAAAGNLAEEDEADYELPTDDDA